MRMIATLFAVLFTIVAFHANADETSPEFKVKSLNNQGVVEEFFTGYKRDAKHYHRAQYRDFRIKAGLHGAEPLPKELDLRPYVQQIRRQKAGSCWAEGGAGATESAIARAFQKAFPFLISTQAFIDCSGYGTASSGGGPSLGYVLKPKGAVYEADYPYNGYDHKCPKNLPIHEQAASVYYIRPLTPENLRRAVYEGAFVELCGASRAIGNGGWKDNTGGGEDHCYEYVGFFDGEAHGKKAGTYDGIVNSWGEGWGEAYGKFKGGFGYYRSVSEQKFGGDVVDEAQAVMFEPQCTPQPVADAGPDKTLVLKGN